MFMTFYPPNYKPLVETQTNTYQNTEISFPTICYKPLLVYDAKVLILLETLKSSLSKHLAHKIFPVINTQVNEKKS